MDYINLTAETLAEIRGTKEIVPKLVTDSLTIDFEAMTEVEKLMHKLIEELDMKSLELAIEKGISLEEARAIMGGYIKDEIKNAINPVYGILGIQSLELSIKEDISLEEARKKLLGD